MRSSNLAYLLQKLRLVPKSDWDWADLESAWNKLLVYEQMTQPSLISHSKAKVKVIQVQVCDKLSFLLITALTDIILNQHTGTNENIVVLAIASR